MHTSHNTSWKKATGEKGPSIDSTETLRCPNCGRLLVFNGFRSRQSLNETHLLDEKTADCNSCDYHGPGFIVVAMEVREIAGSPWADTRHYLETGELVEGC